MNYLTLIGLIIDFIGAVILIKEDLSPTKNVLDGYITNMDQKSGDYKTKGSIKESRKTKLGFSLIAFGFFLQIIGELIS